MSLRQSINAAFDFILKGHDEDAARALAPYKVEAPIKAEKKVSPSDVVYRFSGNRHAVADMISLLFRAYDQRGYGTRIVYSRRLEDGSEEVVVKRALSCD